MATYSVNLKEKLNDSLKAQGVETRGSVTEAYAEILAPEALTFLAKLAHEFEDRRRALLEKRKARQQEIHQGKMPDFLKETAEIRAKDWTVAPIPADLQETDWECRGFSQASSS